MKRQTLSLVLMFATATALCAQDAIHTMRLSTVVIEDVSEPPDIAAEDPLSLESPLDSPLASELPRPAVQTSQASDVAATGGAQSNRRRAITSDQLSRLRRPLAEIHLNGLNSQHAVSQPSFTDSASRWITSGEVGRLDSLQSVTTYWRRRLYFEDATLERCGYSDCVTSVGILTNVHSGTKFLVDTALLPLRMIKERPDALVGAVAE